jgi:serine/threonine protein phosphatase PrpC
MSFECVSRTHVGLRRKINEDSLFADPARGLWVVADGMGGHEAGEIASNMVVDALRCMPPAGGIEELAAAAVEELHRVNRALVELARSTGGDKARTIGTTVVGLAMEEGAHCCFWAGDSRAYRLRDGEIVRVSRDHSLVQNLIDAGMLRPEEAESHANANMITRAVGVGDKFEVDIVRGDALPGDQFVLASDGLTRVVGDEELATALSGGPLDQVADTLIETVLSRGAPDNVTLIIVKVV